MSGGEVELLCRDVMQISNREKMRSLTNEQQELYKKKNICYIHKRSLYIRDHCHYTGKYRGTAHSTCSLKYSIAKEIPVVFHNGLSSDCNFVIK